MSNIAKTPCRLCIFNKPPSCRQGLKQTVEDQQRIAPGWCRAFTTTKDTYYSLPITHSTLIYFDNSNHLNDLHETIISLLQLRFSLKKQLIVFDNNGPNRNTKLYEIIKSYGFGHFKLEQRLESDTSFEKAIDITLKRYTKEDYLIALKAHSKFKPLIMLPFCTVHDRHVMWEFKDKEGIYLRKAFLQLGGGEQFVEKLLCFENHKDLIRPLKDILC